MSLSRSLLSLVVVLAAVSTNSAQDSSGDGSNTIIDIDDAISLSSSSYSVTLLNTISQRGDVLANITIIYNSTYVKSIQHVSYSLYGTGRTYIGINSDGSVTLISTPRVGTTLTVSFSVVVNAIAVGKDVAEPVFLSGRITLRAIDLVGFSASSITVNTAAFLPIGAIVHNLTENVNIATEYIKRHSLSFSGFSSYYTILHSGVLLTRRVFSPGRYSVRVKMDYTLVFNNNSFATGFSYITMTGIAKGCTAREEGTLEWPAMGLCQSAQHACSKYHPFLNGAMMLGYCSDAGTPSIPDFSRCCVESYRTNPFAIVWMTFSGVSTTTFVFKVPSITAYVRRLFPTGSVSSATMFSLYRSNRYYGVSMSFNVQLLPNITTMDLQSALRSLKGYRRFAGSYLRFERESRGIRAFMPSSCCSKYSYAVDDLNTLSIISVPLCCRPGDNLAACSCTRDRNDCSFSAFSSAICSTCPPANATHPNEAQCKAFNPVVVPGPNVPKNETCVRFDPSTLTANTYLGAASQGAKVLTVKMVACSDKHIKSFSVQYGLNGYLADYFDIAKPTGEISYSGVPVTAKLYTFTVSAFVDILFKNGTKAQNFTEAIVRVSVHGGVTLNKTLYVLRVPADITVNDSIIDFSQEKVVNSSIVKQVVSVTFTRVSNSRFGVTEMGDLYSKFPLIPNLINYMTLYYAYTIIDFSDTRKTFKDIAVSVRVQAIGCNQEEGGSYVWPVTHACGLVTVPCHHFDSSFDTYGTVRRQCTFEGKWLQPDFSRCRVVDGSPPFLLVWFTFTSVFTKHWTEVYTTRTVAELQAYLTAFPVLKTTIHHNKESKVVYGFVQSFRVDLNPGASLNGSLLEGLRKRLSPVTRIGGRGKSSNNRTSGVLGFIPSDQCIQFNDNGGVGYFTPVCSKKDGVSCRCKDVEPVISKCCNAEGMYDRAEPVCASDITPVRRDNQTLPDADSSLDIKLKLQGNGVVATWQLINMEQPNYYELVWRCGIYQDQVVVEATKSSYAIERLPPNLLCHINIRAYYDGQLSLGSSNAIKMPPSDVLMFRLILSGITDCDRLRSELDTIRQQLASGLSVGRTLDLSRLGLVVQQCPYGKPDNRMASISGWIFGSPQQPAYSLLPRLQSVAGRSDLLSINNQKVTATKMCDVTKDDTICSDTSIPTKASFSSQDAVDTGGASTAAIAVLIVVCIIGCVLLAVILVIVVLRYRAKPTTVLTTGVTLSGTSKEVEASSPEGLTMDIDTTVSDTTQLDKDF